MRVHWTCISIRLPKLGRQIGTVVYPSFADAPTVWERIGGTGERGREKTCSGSPRCAHPSFRWREDEDTRVPPLVSHVTGDATVCNRRSCATGLIWDAFEVRRIFAPAHGDLNRLCREMGFFNLRFAFPVRLSLSFVRIYFASYLCSGIKSNSGEDIDIFRTRKITLPRFSKLHA